jgi:hypothetical protein
MESLNTVELTELDLRYEACRLKRPKMEERLLLSILKSGIRDPLRGVTIGGAKCLLDGFKRARCARRLSIASVPYLSLGDDAAVGIIDLMRDSFSGKLNIIEEIKLIDALKGTHSLSVAEIADQLDRSKAWVSVRVSMNRELTPVVTRHILSGRFPARSYLYSILPFTRVNGVASETIDRFVERVAGSKLSTRDIELLARKYFNGTNIVKEQIEQGDLKWALQCLKGERGSEANGRASLEQTVLTGLESVQSGMRLVNRHANEAGLASGDFFARVNLVTSAILSEMEEFNLAIRRLYDRSR